MNTLRNLMKGNAAFSALSGLALLAGAAAWNEALGLETWFVAASGAALVGYGGLLATLSRRRDARRGGWFATVMDIGWVAGAAIVLTMFPDAMADAGRTALLLVSVVVAGFGLGQLRALRQMAST